MQPRALVEHWLRYRPLVPVTVVFAAGILLSASGFGRALATGGFAICAARLLIGGRRRYGERTPSSGAFWGDPTLLSGFAMAGAWWGWISFHPAAGDVSRFATGGYVTLTGAVVSDVDVHHSMLTCQMRVAQVILPDGRALSCHGRVYARLRRSADTTNPDYGDTVQARGRLERSSSAPNPGGFDFAAYAARHGIFAELSVRRSSQWRIVPAPAALGDLLPRLAARFRHALLDTLSRLLPPAEAGLLAGLMLGTRVSLPPSINDDFQATGTGHILASSGMNVAIVAGMILGLCRWGRVPRRSAIPITLAALAFYTLLAGAKPSIVRADLMASLFLGGLLLDREGDGPTALAAAALILLLVEPGHLFDPGFQLSFAVVAAILAALPLGRELRSRCLGGAAVAAGGPQGCLHRFLAALVEGAMLTFTAQLAALPLLAQHFNQVPLVGFVANALIVPLAASLMSLGFATWFLSMVWPGVAPLLAASLLSPCLAYLIGAVSFFAKVPGATIAVPSPGWLAVALYYAICGGLIWRLHAPRKEPR